MIQLFKDLPNRWRIFVVYFSFFNVTEKHNDFCYYAGSQHGYHSISIGLYGDQLVRSVDPKGRSLAQFVHDEISIPLGVPKKENMFLNHSSILFGTDVHFQDRIDCFAIFVFCTHTQNFINRVYCDSGSIVKGIVLPISLN